MSSGAFDKTFDRPGGKAFTIRRRAPTDAHHSTGTTNTFSRDELERPSCPACYRPGLEAGYCTRCITAGHAKRHQENRNRGW